MPKQPIILFNFPTRGRRERFFKSLDSIVNNLYDKENFLIHVAADSDDEEMNNEEVIKAIEGYPNTRIVFGNSESKIHACNRDLHFYDGYQILCNHSDDMLWTFYGFDMILRQPFEEGDFDKLIHIPDSDAKQFLATYYIAGKDYFKRFNYIYHPSYKSLFADNEVQDIAKQLGKYHYIDCPGVLFHEHPSYSHIEFDEQYKTQQGFWGEDEQNYNNRKALNFPI